MMRTPQKSGLIKIRNNKEIKKVVMCSGKIYYDLIEAREKAKIDNIIFYSNRTTLSISC